MMETPELPPLEMASELECIPQSLPAHVLEYIANMHSTPEYVRACKTSLEVLISPRRSELSSASYGVDIASYGVGTSPYLSREPTRLPSLTANSKGGLPHSKRSGKGQSKHHEKMPHVHGISATEKQLSTDSRLHHRPGWQRLRQARETLGKWEQVEVEDDWTGAASAAHTHRERRQLRAQAPNWWAMSSEDREAADAFDLRHRQRCVKLDRVCLSALESQITGRAHRQTLQDEFERARLEVQWNRYSQPWRPEHPACTARSPRKVPQAKAKPKSLFDLDDSVWAPRARYSDSRSYYDTREVQWKRFDVDFTRLLGMDLTKMVLMHDDDETPGDEDGDGIPDEVEDVAGVLCENHEALRSLFCYYACMGAGSRGRFDQMSLSTWTVSRRLWWRRQSGDHSSRPSLLSSLTPHDTRSSLLSLATHRSSRVTLGCARNSPSVPSAPT